MCIYVTAHVERVGMTGDNWCRLQERSGVGGIEGDGFVKAEAIFCPRTARYGGNYNSEKK